MQSYSKMNFPSLLIPLVNFHAISISSFRLSLAAIPPPTPSVERKTVSFKEEVAASSTDALAVPERPNPQGGVSFSTGRGKFAFCAWAVHVFRGKDNSND